MLSIKTWGGEIMCILIVGKTALCQFVVYLACVSPISELVVIKN